MSPQTDIDKRCLIKSAARELFCRFGINKTSLNEISQRCQLPKPTIYYYFPGKQAIFDEIVLDEAQAFIQHVKQQIPPGLPVDKRIAWLARSIYNDMKSYAAEMLDTPQWLGEFSPHGQPVLKKIRQLFEEELLLLLREGKQSGVLEFADETTTIQTLSFMTDFIRMDWMNQHPETLRDQVIDNLIHIVLYGLIKQTHP